MAASLITNLGGVAQNSATTTLALSVSASITTGDSIFVAFSYDVSATSVTCTDNLGNTYTVQRTINNVGGTCLLACLFSVAGALTTLTLNWTTSSTKKGMYAGHFRDVGPALTIAAAETAAGKIGRAHV